MLNLWIIRIRFRFFISESELIFGFSAHPMVLISVLVLRAKVLVFSLDTYGLSLEGSTPLSSTWPHLNSDVGLEKGEY